ncbi:unnamed protein product [Nezara viridula]|uniref:Legumain n=1 Tax=Nezara viridula TaxID=85310 RepID=A0A9P0HHW8_NEZVI|nr:unnamed protein product [Nezara viridula]
MMSDDIAFNQDNPTPGVIINHPGGPNVYKGVPKDYTGKNVTADNFLNILTGNKTAMRGIGSGKVIESGPDDLVFINFVDHGGVGVLYFPNEELYADEFLEAINLMSTKSKYSKLIMYVEACHAGSIFDNMLPDTTRVFALTAADPHESSYACYYDKQRETYLGDVFSIIWMNDTEHESLPSESLHHQFEKVRTYTNTSHVEEYGDLDIGITKLKDVLGFKMRLMKSMGGLNPSYSSTVVKPQHPMDTTDNMDIPLDLLDKKKSTTKDPEKCKALESEIDDLNKQEESTAKEKNTSHIAVMFLFERHSSEADRERLRILPEADIYHAYQIIKRNRIPDENIVVMVNDDIAYHSSNPTPGVIINYPGGPNVYEGLLKDYTGAMVMYIEACFAGSLFDNMLPDDINVFAITAADAREPSEGCFRDDEQNTWLSNVFSTLWMSFAEHESFSEKSLHHHYEKVRSYTNTSHPQEYGDLDVGVMKLKYIIGERVKTKRRLPPRITPLPTDVINSIDIPLQILVEQIRAATDPLKKKQLKWEHKSLIERRESLDKLFNDIMEKVTENDKIKLNELRTSKMGLNRGHTAVINGLRKVFRFEECQKIRTKDRRSFSSGVRIGGSCGVDPNGLFLFHRNRPKSDV